MTSATRRILTERAPALATMYLTRRDDLSINYGHKEWGVDLVVDIINVVNGRRTGGRMFGVQLKCSREPIPIDAANRTFKPSVVGSYKKPQLPFPVLIFYYTLDDNEAYYGWILEPVVRDDGSAKLERRKTALCTKLDRKELDSIVEKVARWYDALYRTARG
jgi:hypothetical protein